MPQVPHYESGLQALSRLIRVFPQRVRQHQQFVLLNRQAQLRRMTHRTRGRCYCDRVIPCRRSRLPGTPAAAPTAAATSSAAILEADHHQDHEQHAKQLPAWSTLHAAESKRYQRDRKRVL